MSTYDDPSDTFTPTGADETYSATSDEQTYQSDTGSYEADTSDSAVDDIVEPEPEPAPKAKTKATSAGTDMVSELTADLGDNLAQQDRNLAAAIMLANDKQVVKVAQRIFPDDPEVLAVVQLIRGKVPKKLGDALALVAALIEEDDLLARVDYADAQIGTGKQVKPEDWRAAITLLDPSLDTSHKGTDVARTVNAPGLRKTASDLSATIERYQHSGL